MNYEKHIGALRDEIRKINSKVDWQRQRIDLQQRQIDRLLEHLGLSLNNPSNFSYQEGVLKIETGRSDVAIQLTGDSIVRFHDKENNNE